MVANIAGTKTTGECTYISSFRTQLYLIWTKVHSIYVRKNRNSPIGREVAHLGCVAIEPMQMFLFHQTFVYISFGVNGILQLSVQMFRTNLNLSQAGKSTQDLNITFLFITPCFLR